MEKISFDNAVQVINGGVSPMVNDLDRARIDFVKSEATTGEKQKAYAKRMVEFFGLEWYSATGETKKLVKAEHEKFVNAFEAIGKTRANIDQIWSRIKDESGRTKAPKVSGGQSVDDLNIRDLKTILNRIASADADSAPFSYKVRDRLLTVADLMGISTEKDLKK